MPSGRFALGKNGKEKVPQGYTKEDPLIPLFEDEGVIALGTEPFPDIATAEKFKHIIGSARGGDIKSASAKRKRKKKGNPLLDPSLTNWISESDPTKPPSLPAPKDEGEDENEEEDAESGPFEDASNLFF